MEKIGDIRGNVSWRKMSLLFEPSDDRSVEYPPTADWLFNPVWETHSEGPSPGNRNNTPQLLEVVRMRFVAFKQARCVEVVLLVIIDRSRHQVGAVRLSPQ